MSNVKKSATVGIAIAVLVSSSAAFAVYEGPDVINLSGTEQTVGQGNGPNNSKTFVSVDQQTVSTSYGDGTFIFDKQQPTGSGVLQPFVRLQDNVEEQGYNTTPSTGKNNDMPFETKADGWTYDVKISDLEGSKVTIVNPDGTTTEYVDFILDLGEPKSDNKKGDQSLLSLDGLRLFSSTVGGQYSEETKPSDTVGDWDWTRDENGAQTDVNTLLWDLDDGANRTVLLDAERGYPGDPSSESPGNGVSDMVFRVDASIFEKAVGDYFILWSRFGIFEDYRNGSESFGTFEEWAFLSKSGELPNPPGLIPSPAPLALIGMGLIAMYRRAQRQPNGGVTTDC